MKRADDLQVALADIFLITSEGGESTEYWWSESCRSRCTQENDLEIHPAYRNRTRHFSMSKRHIVVGITSRRSSYRLGRVAQRQGKGVPDRPGNHGQTRSSESDGVKQEALGLQGEMSLAVSNKAC